MRIKRGLAMLNRKSLRLAASALLYVCAPIGVASAEFYATQDATGDILVVDEAGTPVPVVVGEPVGTRATVCPNEAFYVVTLPTDMSQLVLTDCATETEQHAVEMQN
jgi:hypothetical protein